MNLLLQWEFFFFFSFLQGGVTYRECGCLKGFGRWRCAVCVCVSVVCVHARKESEKGGERRKAEVGGCVCFLSV